MSKNQTRSFVGRQIVIPAGTKVNRLGVTAKRTSESVVTVRRTEQTRTGKTRIFWKSCGYPASTVI